MELVLVNHGKLDMASIQCPRTTPHFCMEALLIGKDTAEV